MPAESPSSQAIAVRPIAGLRCSDQDAEILIDKLGSVGYRVIRLPSDEAVSVGLVDIEEAGIDQTVSALSSRGVHVIVFGDDPDDIQEVRYRSLGASAVLPKRHFFGDVARHVPSIV
jgi:hypothetical protein